MLSELKIGGGGVGGGVWEGIHWTEVCSIFNDCFINVA